MRVTISSDVPAVFTVTLHPVDVSNGVTQSTVLSFEPFSTYPAHATRLTWPSPVPNEASLAMLGGFRPDPGAAVPPLVPPLLQAASVSAPMARRPTRGDFRIPDSLRG